MRFASYSFRFFLLVIVAAIGLALFEWARGHPQDMPWTPLSLAEPVGRFTPLKLSRLGNDFAGCRALLDAAQEAYSIAAPVSGAPGCGYTDGVRLRASKAYGYAPDATVRCGLGAALFLWEKQVVEPAAARYFGQAVTRVDTFGTYSCRPIRGGREGQWSEHASANAIDIAGFRLSDGRRITVAADWRGEGDEAAFLREVRDGACRIFGTTLSPDYNALHRDHLHLDQAGRGGWTYCR